MKRKFKSVAKTKKGVPKKYVSGAKNKTAKEREILDTRERYKRGLPLALEKVSTSRASQAKSKTRKTTSNR